MDSEKFVELYTHTDADELITPFSNDVGFSLVRNYPKDSLYYKDGKKMFIKISVRKDTIFYSVDMVVPDQSENQTSYIITEGNEYKRKVTNFFSDTKEPFIFDPTTKEVVYKKKNRKFNLNNFVNIIIRNHLSDRLFIKRKLNMLVKMMLIFLFWLSDKHYEPIKTSIDKYHFGRQNQPTKEDKKDVEPFFKYFYVSKNILFTVLIISFSVSIFSGYYWILGDFSLSNPSIVLLLFLTLFAGEKFSVWLDRTIKEFFASKINFIEKLHNFQFNNRFNLRLNK